MIFPTRQIFHYIEQLYEERGLNKNDYTNITYPFSGGDVIDDDVARFFSLLLMIKRPVHILEIGTSIGFSTVIMAKIIQPYGGKITTIELDKKTVQKAKENFIRYHVAEHVEIVQGDANDKKATKLLPFSLILLETDIPYYFQSTHSQYDIIAKKECEPIKIHHFLYDFTVQ